jgi:hypothetical protein
VVSLASAVVGPIIRAKVDGLLGLSVTAKNQPAAVVGRKVSIQHLDGSKLLEHCFGRQARSSYAQALAQIGVQSHKDVGLDPLLKLIKNGT